MIVFRYKLIISTVLYCSIIACDAAKCSDSKQFTCRNGQCIDTYSLCDGTRDCRDGSDEILETCSNITCPEYTFRCAYGACVDLDTRCNGISDCSDDSDESPDICRATNQIRTIRSTKANVTCAPHISETVESKCQLNGAEVDCSKPIPDGTILRMQCKPLHIPTDDSSNNVRICTDGSWDYPFIKCVPDCGKMPPKEESLIGETKNTGVPPWHVGVYKQTSPNQYTRICGGSIISPNIIVSAAHCFTDYRNGALQDAKDYVVAAGKYYPNHDDVRDLMAQKIQVTEIKIPPRYKGQLTNYAADIAFVVLKKSFTITRPVQPVCIDWKNQYESEQLSESNFGMVPSWGSKNTGLQQVNVPFVPHERCLNEVPPSFTQFLTIDKFCTGYTNDTGHCLGDGGNGLTFKQNDRYYLRGVMSTAPRKDDSCTDIRVYTKVSDYLDLSKTVLHLK